MREAITKEEGRKDYQYGIKGGEDMDFL